MSFSAAAFLGFYAQRDQAFKNTFRVYPDASYVTGQFDYLDPNTGVQAVYYWTNAPFQNVRRHYRTFAYPFDNPGNRFIYSPFGDDLPVIANPNSPVCSSWDHAAEKCVEIHLIDFGTSARIELPSVQRLCNCYAPEGQFPTPEAGNFLGGTVVIYLYYTHEL